MIADGGWGGGREVLIQNTNITRLLYTLIRKRVNTLFVTCSKKIPEPTSNPFDGPSHGIGMCSALCRLAGQFRQRCPVRLDCGAMPCLLVFSLTCPVHSPLQWMNASASRSGKVSACRPSGQASSLPSTSAPLVAMRTTPGRPGKMIRILRTGMSE